MAFRSLLVLSSLEEPGRRTAAGPNEPFAEKDKQQISRFASGAECIQGWSFFFSFAAQSHHWGKSECLDSHVAKRSAPVPAVQSPSQKQTERISDGPAQCRQIGSRKSYILMRFSLISAWPVLEPHTTIWSRRSSVVHASCWLVRHVSNLTTVPPSELTSSAMSIGHPSALPRHDWQFLR